MSCYRGIFVRILSFVCAVAAVGRAAEKIAAVDARQLDKPAKITLASVQAIANRERPRLMLIVRDTDLGWQRAIEQQTGASFGTISPEDAIARFAGDAKQIIYDRNQLWTTSIATTMAGLKGAILTDHDLGRPTEFDCTGKWPDKIEAYRWAIRELLPQCDPTRLCYLDQPRPQLRDYAIQQKLFTFDLDPLNDEQEIALIDEILAKFPPQARIFGYPPGRYADPAKKQNDVTAEVKFVERISKRGKLLVPADVADNMSLYSKIPATREPLKQTRLNRDTLKLEPGSKYVLLVISDGDNLQYNLIHMRELWTDPAWPKTPVAWTISPQWAELVPFVLATYYREARQRGAGEEFVAGPSGYAYINPGDMSDDVLDAFLASTKESCEASDLRSIAILDRRSRPRDQVMKFIARYSKTGADAVWLSDQPALAGASGRMAYLAETVRFDSDGALAAGKVLGLKSKSPFVFVYVNAWFTSAPAMKDFVATIGDSATIVSPTEMASLIRQASAAQP